MQALQFLKYFDFATGLLGKISDDNLAFDMHSAFDCQFRLSQYLEAITYISQETEFQRPLSQTNSIAISPSTTFAGDQRLSFKPVLAFTDETEGSKLICEDLVPSRLGRDASATSNFSKLYTASNTPILKPDSEVFDRLCPIQDHQEKRGVQKLTTAFEIEQLEDEHCHENVSNCQSPLSLAKDTAAALTTDNTPATLKIYPALPHQHEGLNMMQMSSKCIIIDTPNKPNHGSAQQPRQNVHQKDRLIHGLDSSDEDRRARKHKKSIGKISAGNTSRVNPK